MFASSFASFCQGSTHAHDKSHPGHPMRPPKHPREPHTEPPEHAKPPQETPQDTPRAPRDPPEHAKAPQETPQDTPGDPQEAPKAPQGSLRSFILSSFWVPGWVIGWESHFHGFVMLLGSLFELILAPFSIQKLIIFVIQSCMFFYCVSTPFFFNFTSIFKGDSHQISRPNRNGSLRVFERLPARDAHFQEPGLSKIIQNSLEICPKIYPKN